MPAEFSNRSILITGAASGIGLATAHRLADAGAAHLLLCDRDGGALDAAVGTLGRERLAPVRLHGDVADEAFWTAAEPTLGPIDHAVIAAGVAGSGTIAELDYAEWRRLLSVNLDGAFLALRAAMRAMIKRGAGGSIVLVASVSGLKAEAGVAAYGASKAAVIHLARVAAKEGAAHGIRVNAIAPGGVETPIWRGMAFFEELIREKGSEAAAFAAMAQMATPLGRYAKPDEVAGQIAFLLSDAAALITGTALVADGGYML
jgi:2-keto-3-deoxy-L-fuconate dehydrogenase